jgi:hypothetical protein
VQYQSEHDAAFPTQDRDRVTRGLHFHNEALRLWALEEMQPSLTNVQALCILSLESVSNLSVGMVEVTDIVPDSSNYRAKDKLGLKLVPLAVQLDAKLQSPDEQQLPLLHGVSAAEYSRASLAAYYAAFSTLT